METRKLSRQIIAPLVVNAALVGLLIVNWTTGRADAQATPARARGDYTMVSGRTNAGGNEAVAVLDAANQELVFLRWDQGRKQMAVIGYRGLAADSNPDPGR